MIDYEIYNMGYTISYAALIAGLSIVFITTNLDKTKRNNVLGTISGLCVALFGVLLLIGMTTANLPSVMSLMSILQTYTPLLLLSFNLGLYITLLSVFFNAIIQKHTSQYYEIFSFVSVGFIMIQVAVFTLAMRESDFWMAGMKMSPSSLSKMLVLGLLNIISLISMGISLKHYRTDG